MSALTLWIACHYYCTTSACYSFLFFLFSSSLLHSTNVGAVHMKMKTHIMGLTLLDLESSKPIFFQLVMLRHHTKFSLFQNVVSSTVLNVRKTIDKGSRWTRKVLTQTAVVERSAVVYQLCQGRIKHNSSNHV